MAIQTMTLDPAAGPMTGDAIVTAINAGSSAITRANAVSAAARPIAALEVTNAMLATGVAKANLDAMTATARGYIQTAPTTGQFKVTAVQRDATGKLAVSYDDVAA
jgi:hypothetical protein